MALEQSDAVFSYFIARRHGAISDARDHASEQSQRHLSIESVLVKPLDFGNVIAVA
jgi:hypothetical protein